MSRSRGCQKSFTRGKKDGWLNQIDSNLKGLGLYVTEGLVTIKTGHGPSEFLGDVSQNNLGKGIAKKGYTKPYPIFP